MQIRRACQEDSRSGEGPSLPLTDALAADPLGFLSRYPLRVDVTSLPPSASPSPQGSTTSASMDAVHLPDANMTAVNVTSVNVTAGRGGATAGSASSAPAWLVGQQVVDDVDSLIGEWWRRRCGQRERPSRF